MSLETGSKIVEGSAESGWRESAKIVVQPWR
jgi:hypothetical protein